MVLFYFMLGKVVFDDAFDRSGGDVKKQAGNDHACQVRKGVIFPDVGEVKGIDGFLMDEEVG